MAADSTTPPASVAGYLLRRVPVPITDRWPATVDADRLKLALRKCRRAAPVTLHIDDSVPDASRDHAPSGKRAHRLALLCCATSDLTAAGLQVAADLVGVAGLGFGPGRLVA